MEVLQTFSFPNGDAAGAGAVSGAAAGAIGTVWRVFDVAATDAAVAFLRFHFFCF